MAISWRTATGLTAAADTATPFANLAYTLPTGHTTNDVLICVAAVRPYTLTVGTPTDYTARGSVTSGANTANGVGVGSSKVQAFSKIHDGSESNPASTMAAGYTPAMTAMLAAYSSGGSSAGWVVESTTGADSTVTGTSISATGGSLTWVVGDQIVAISAGCDNLDTEASVTITFSGGVTHSGLTEQIPTNVTTTGNDGSLYVYTGTINGAGTGAPTFAATGGVSGASDRGVVFLRINEGIAQAVSQDDSVNLTDTMVVAQDDAVTDAGIGVTDVDQPVVDHNQASVPHSRAPEDAVGITDADRAVSLSIVADTIEDQIDVIDTDEPTTLVTGDIPRAPEDGVGVTDGVVLDHGIAYAETGVGITDVDQPDTIIATSGYEVLIEEDCEFTDSLQFDRSMSLSVESVGISDSGWPTADIGDTWNISPDTIGVGITDSLTLDVQSYFTDAGISITGAPEPVSDGAVAHSRTPYDQINLSDAGQPSAVKDLTLAVSIDDTVELFDGGTDFTIGEDLSDGVGVTDGVALDRQASAGDLIGVTDEIALSVSVLASDSTGLTDIDSPEIDKTGGVVYYRTLDGEFVNITDAGGVDVVLYQPSTFSVSIDSTVNVTGGTPETDQVVGGSTRNPEDRVDLTDSIALDRTLEISDLLGVGDTAGSGVSKGAITDPVGLSDSLYVAIDKGLYDTSGLGDYSQPEVDHEIVGVSQRPVDSAVGLSDEIAITIARVVTVEDLLDLIDTQTLSGPNISLGVADVLGLSDDVDVLGWRPVWSLNPPTIDEAPIGGGRLFSFYKMPRGISLLVTGATVVEKRFPTQDELEACDYYYLGGHISNVGPEEAQILIDAGYEDNLTMIGEVVHVSE